MFRSLLIAAASAALLGGCSQGEPDRASAAATATAPQPAASSNAGGAAPAAQAHNTGKVVQSQNGGGYTYAEVETATGEKVWIAGAQIDVKPGTQVEWGNHALMRNFEAKSLGRSFAEILFVDGWAVAGQAPVAVAPHGSFPAPQLGGGSAPGATDSGTVKSVSSAGGYSYIEVDRGNGQTVWVAAMETPMKQGDKVEWQGGSEMSNFTARSIGRTFDKIIFAQALSVAK